MHLLITGGSGFIGRALCKELPAWGHQVTVLSRQPAKARLPSNVRVVDRLDGLREIEGVINLAGENLADGRWTPARKQAFRDSRLGTTKRLLDWLEHQAPRPTVLISGSAIGYYGARGDEELSESADPGEDFAARLCRDWEAEAIRAEALGLRVCRLRIGVVLSPGGGALARMLPAFRLGLGGRLGDGQQWMSWIRRADLVQLILWLLRTPTAAGAYNATAPHPVRNAEFAAELSATLNRPAMLPMPAPVLRAMFGEMSDLLLRGQRVIPARALAEGFQFSSPRLQMALREMLSS